MLSPLLSPWILLADLVITGGINLFVGALPGTRLLPRHLLLGFRFDGS